ncbi:MAG TPA: thioredoxin domain-containing protein, partial [Polyangiaceae bacterium]|nr:thioredoxin domain-containing protein [Polyangiaceae bacterium]
LKQTVFASFLGVPTPVYGVAGFVAIGALAVLRGPSVRRTLLALASGAALVALALLAVQALAATWCRFCLVADVSGCVIFGAALWRFRAKWDPPPARLPRTLLAVGMAPAFLAPLAFGFSRKPIVPDAIAEELARTPHGAVTVIDFADFECPFCRMTHPELRAVLQAHPGKVRVVRREVPLKMHPHAMDAARSECCAEKLGKGESMANALFTAPAEELTPEGCEKIAREVGLPLEAYRACVADPATDALIAADKAEFQAAGGFALPTLWVDEVPLVGAQPEERIEEAVTAAMARAGS